MTSLIRSSVAAVALALPLSAFAAGAIDQLRSFVESTQSGRATFDQQVIAKSGRKPQNASGTMAFSRPGKFRWTYEKPYYQLLVGDGEDRHVTAESLHAAAMAAGEPVSLATVYNTLRAFCEAGLINEISV
ncbi:MAG: outer-membrane lipoprotein carrier protein LolA, partial [Burkholderiaceae bacterium]